MHLLLQNLVLKQMNPQISDMRSGGEKSGFFVWYLYGIPGGEGEYKATLEPTFLNGT